MTVETYEKYIRSTKKKYNNKAYSIIALNEEAGECAGWWKKAVLKGELGKEGLTKADFLLELGDVLKHLTILAHLNHKTLKDIMALSVEKYEAEKKEGKK